MRLSAAGIPTPRLDAAILLAHVLAVERHVLAVHPDVVVGADDASLFDSMIEQRASRRPISHLVGEVEFWSLPFRVSDATLAPRPETEMLVELAAAFLRLLAAPIVVEVGTGTGCIAIAIAHEVPQAQVHSVDVSAPALAIARENVARNGVAARVRLHEGDTLGPLSGVLEGGSVDVVVSNPPYVRRDERDTVDPEVLWEPETAVFCDGEPWEVYERIAREGAVYARSGALLLLELPGEDPAAVVDAIEAPGVWTDVFVLPDLAGLPRVLRAVRL